MGSGVLQGWLLQKGVKDCPVPDTAVPTGSAMDKKDPPYAEANPDIEVSRTSAEMHLRKGEKCREK